MEKNKSFKNFSYIGIGRLVAIVLQAIFYLLFASLLGPESYGQLSVIIAFAGAFAAISGFGLHHTITVFQAKKKSKLSEQVKTLSLVITSIGALILLTINEYAALLSLALSFFLMNQHNLLGLQKYKHVMIFSIVKGALILVIPFLLYFLFEISGIILGMAIGNLIASGLYFKSLKMKSFFGLKKQFKVIIHNFGVETSNTLPRILDKLLIAPLFGFFIVGIYQFNFQILFALEALPAVLHAYILSEESSGVRHKKIVNLSILGSVVIALIAIVLAPFFVNEFFPKYSEGVFSLQIMVLSIIPLTVSSVFSAKLQAKESTRIGISAIIRIGTLLVLLAFLGELYGLEGFSLAVLFSIIINTIFLSILYYKYR